MPNRGSSFFTVNAERLLMTAQAKAVTAMGSQGEPAGGNSHAGADSFQVVISIQAPAKNTKASMKARPSESGINRMPTFASAHAMNLSSATKRNTPRARGNR